MLASLDTAGEAQGVQEPPKPLGQPFCFQRRKQEQRNQVDLAKVKQQGQTGTAGQSSRACEGPGHRSKGSRAGSAEKVCGQLASKTPGGEQQADRDKRPLGHPAR